MRHTPHRSGFTLIELIAVLVVVLILAGLIVPTLKGMKGNGDQKAAADVVRARLADARSLAMNDCIPYRLAINQDGIRIRYAPDGTDFADLPSSDVSGASTRVLECKIEHSSLVMTSYDSNSQVAGPDSAGWITVATFQPDGTSLQDKAMIEVHSDGFPPMRIAFRGITGGSSVLPPVKSGGSNP